MNSSERPGLSTPHPVFVLTIDTEEEWDWSGRFPRPPFSTENIQQVPDFQEFCQEIDIAPTYFVNYAVVDKPENVSLLEPYLTSNQCDIGAHLHPWCTPPIVEEICEYNSHAVNLPIELFESKMLSLTDRLTSSFGQHPLSFRAGRWGINGQQLKVLANLGYQIDSSVRPFYFDSTFSYAKAKTRAYWPSFDDLIDEDRNQTQLLEVPVSSGFNHTPFELLHKISTKLSTPPISRMRFIGILWQLGLLRKITVTPEGHDKDDICRCIDMSIARGDRIINMFFHSSDLLPGATPYVQSVQDKVKFLDCVRHCVDHMRKKHNAVFLTMRQIQQALSGSR